MSLRPLFRRAAGAALLVALLVTACGDDSGSEEEDQSTDPPTTEEPTTTTHPSATDDEAAAFAADEEVFHERQRLMDLLTEEPGLVNDPDSDVVEQLRELVTGDEMEATVDGRVSSAEELAEAGEHVQPAGEVISDSGIYRPEAVDADRSSSRSAFWGTVSRSTTTGSSSGTNLRRVR